MSDSWRCEVCGLVVPGYAVKRLRGRSLQHDCRPRVPAEPPPPPPTFLEKAAHFGQAMIAAAGVGFAVRPIERIQEIYEVHCAGTRSDPPAPCKYFRADECTVCGCNVNRERSILNKLALESESCPKRYWK